MEANRIYKGSDSDMYSQVMGCMRFFEKHLADFSAFDPHLNQTYYDNWLAASEIAGRLAIALGDESETRSDGFLIDDAQKVLVRCQRKYKEAKYFAGKAFPDNTEALKEFGEGTYSKVRSSHLRMVQFMETLYGVATKYKTELLAQNYTQAAIDEIATLAADLRTASQKQQLKKKERPTETRKRVEALNAFYRFGQRVAEAAKDVFADSPVLRNQFLLAKRHHPKVSKAWLNVGAAATRKTALTKLLKKHTVTLTNQSKETVEYWQADNINQTPAKKYTLTAGEIISIEAEEPARKFLLVHNASQKAVRLVMTKTKNA